METERLIEIIEQEGFEIREGYSGRGMQGQECLGFLVESGSELAAVASIVASGLGDDEVQDLARFFQNCRQDSMGRVETIIYFPKVVKK